MDVPVLVVDLVAVSRGVHNVEAKSDAILGDDCTRLHSTTETEWRGRRVLTMRNGVNLCRLPDWLICFQAAL